MKRAHFQMTKFYISAFALCLIANVVLGQAEAKMPEKWTLQQCIEYAFEHNIQVQQNIITKNIAEQDLKASRYNVLPNLNGSATHIYNFGQTIDPFTNTFATTQVRSNQLALSSSLTLFDGLRNINNVKLNKAQLEANKYDLESIKNDISLNIANAYLTILFNRELAKNAERQLNVTSIQIDRIEKQVNAGTLPQGSLQEIQAQYASEELQLVNAKNQLKLSKINLAQLLNLESSEDFNIDEPDLSNFQGVSELITPGALYETAVDIMPEVKRAEYNFYAAEKSKSLARGSYYPTITVNGSIGSGYSGANNILTGPGTNVGFVPIGQVSTTGDPVVSLSPRTIYGDDDYETKKWDDQLEDNFNKSIGFRLSVPLFNGMNSRTNVQKAKLNAQSAELNLDNTKLQLRQNIESAHAEAVAALKRYKAAEKSVEALKTSFDYTNQRFSVGLVNSFDFSNEKNRLNNAESELLQAKYEYIFKTKVLDFYRGQALSFNQ